MSLSTEATNFFQTIRLPRTNQTRAAHGLSAFEPAFRGDPARHDANDDRHRHSIEPFTIVRERESAAEHRHLLGHHEISSAASTTRSASTSMQLAPRRTEILRFTEFRLPRMLRNKTLPPVDSVAYANSCGSTLGIHG